MTITELIDYLKEWIETSPEDKNMPVVCTDSIRFENGLHEITDAIIIDDDGIEKLQLW
jgi:hypothetical protein